MQFQVHLKHPHLLKLQKGQTFQLSHDDLKAKLSQLHPHHVALQLKKTIHNKINRHLMQGKGIRLSADDIEGYGILSSIKKGLKKGIHQVGAIIKQHVPPKLMHQMADRAIKELAVASGHPELEGIASKITNQIIDDGYSATSASDFRRKANHAIEEEGKAYALERLKQHLELGEGFPKGTREARKAMRHARRARRPEYRLKKGEQRTIDRMAELRAMRKTKPKKQSTKQHEYVDYDDEPTTGVMHYIPEETGGKLNLGKISKSVVHSLKHVGINPRKIIKDLVAPVAVEAGIPPSLLNAGIDAGLNKANIGIGLKGKHGKRSKRHLIEFEGGSFIPAGY